MAGLDLRLPVAVLVVWVVSFLSFAPASVPHHAPCECTKARGVTELSVEQAGTQTQSRDGSEVGSSSSGDAASAGAATGVPRTGAAEESLPPTSAPQEATSSPTPTAAPAPPTGTPPTGAPMTASPPETVAPSSSVPTPAPSAPVATPTSAPPQQAAASSSPNTADVKDVPSSSGNPAAARKKESRAPETPKPQVTEFNRWPRVAAAANVDPRRADVVRMLNESWQGYKRHAWGRDEFSPISKKAGNWWKGGGLGLMTIDAVDTLLLAGMDDEAGVALAWIEEKLNFDQKIKVSGFEMTIRVLGGLLSTYQITGRARLLRLARDLGARLSKAFDTPAEVPHNFVNLKTGEHSGVPWNKGASLLAEFGTLQMEHYTLSQETGDNAFFRRARRAVEVIAPWCPAGYCPMQFLNKKPVGKGMAGLGYFGDSFYEYLLKQWILSGKQDGLFKEMWDKAARHTIDTSRTYNGTLVPNGNETDGTLTHLACFSGGLFALSYMHTNNTEHLQMGKDIAEACHTMHATASGLPPEVAQFKSNGSFVVPDGKYVLRPEIVETYFYLWRATKDPKYRDWGYELMTAIETHLKVPGVGYVGAKDVTKVPVPKIDNMETFWFGETLKYLYLLFSDDELLDLDTWVFNTEAHPMRVQAPMPTPAPSPAPTAAPMPPPTRTPLTSMAPATSVPASMPPPLPPSA